MSMLIIVLVLAIMSAAGCAIYYNIVSSTSQNVLELVTVEDIHIPLALENQFGLFFYDLAGNATKSTQKSNAFNNSKPLIIFFNLSVNNEISSSDEQAVFQKWLNAGYNVGSFKCGQVVQNKHLYWQRKIWSNKEEDIIYSDNDSDGNQMFYPQILNYSIAEIFVAYYYDFMTKSVFVGDQIRFEGLSLGVQTMLAACSYLLALEENRVIDNRFLPDRVTCLNGFFDYDEKNIDNSWLDKPITQNEDILFHSANIARAVWDRGIAIEYIEMKTNGIQETDKEKLLKEVVYLEYIYDSNQVNEDKTVFDWYNTMLGHNIPLDYSFDRLNQYGVSPKTPTSYIYARIGTHYKLRANDIELEEYNQYSTNARVPFIAGFIFNDKNKNGIYDERLNGRLSGVDVELYLLEEDASHRLIGRSKVNSNGYYRFPIEPIYIFNTSGKQFYIKVKQYTKYLVAPTLSINAYNMMTNNVEKDWQSDRYFIYSIGELVIINIGLIER